MRHLASIRFVRRRRCRAFIMFVSGAPFKIGSLLLAAILISLALANNSAIADVLLQSPASPPEAPTDAEAAPEPAQPAPAEPNIPAAEPVSPLTDEPAQTQQQEQTAPLPEPIQPQPIDRIAPLPESDRETANLTLDQAELIDTVIITTAYVWLCCGFIIILLIPLIFLFLYIRGRSKIIKEEIY